MKDLVALVPDKNTQFTLQGLFSRHRSFNIRDISEGNDIFPHPQRDPGCYNQCVDFLRPFTKEYKHALVIFDHEGSGQDDRDPKVIEAELENQLTNSGWEERAAVIVLVPELEIWVWSDSPHVDRILGWEDCVPNLKDWLTQENFFDEIEIKPHRPKEALERALRHVKKPRSSAIYQELAEKVSFLNCIDDAFIKLNFVLKKWFAEQ